MVRVTVTSNLVLTTEPLKFPTNLCLCGALTFVVTDLFTFDTIGVLTNDTTGMQCHGNKLSVLILLRDQI